jgi:hypothetical protein
VFIFMRAMLLDVMSVSIVSGAHDARAHVYEV